MYAKTKPDSNAPKRETPSDPLRREPGPPNRNPYDNERRV